MSRLFIELYFDEDVDVRIAQVIRAFGFTVTTTVEAGQLGQDDPSQLAYAASQNKALLTHNRADFEALAQQYFSSGQSHAGIIIAVRRPPLELVKRLTAILNSVTADEIRDQLRYI